MRMISKIHDYYDGVARNTINDKTYTFVRNGSVLENIDVPYLGTISFNSPECDITFQLIVVGFCDKIYPGLEVAHYDKSTYESTISYFYDLESVKCGIDFDVIPDVAKHRCSMQLNIKKRLENWLTNGRSIYYSPLYHHPPHDIRCNLTLKNLFYEHGVAYFKVSSHPIKKSMNVQLYPILKDCQFYKIFDSYSCFQQIEQFLTNQLIDRDKIDAIIPDVMKIHTHGFDKWSFRKQKIDTV